MSATALAIVLFNVRSSFEHYRSVCSAASEACSQRVPAQPTTEGLRQLREAGLSAGTYADLHVAIDKVLQLVWFSVGALNFFRRSDDRMALLVSAFLVAFGTVTVDDTGADALAAAQQAWWLPVKAVQITGQDCVVLFFLLFPGGRFVPRWTRWLALAAIANELSRTHLPELYYLSSALQGLSLWAFVGMVAILT